MVNFNGEIIKDNNHFLSHSNRGLLFGDVLHEEIRVLQGKIIYWEDHYFHLMASMRILRMEIPMAFTMEFLEEKILEAVKVNDLLGSAVIIKLTVFREGGPNLLPKNNNVSYIITTKVLETPFYTIAEGTYEVALFKDYFVNQDMLSNLDTNNNTLAVVASIYAQENGYQDCVMLNTAKQVVGSITGSLFLIKGTHIKTPPLSSGAKNTVIRKKMLEIIGALAQFEVAEADISPFDLQKADELFVLSCSKGIEPIAKYRKKTYANTVAQNLLAKLNANIRLANLG